MKLQLCAISGSREGETFVVEDHSRVSFGRTAASDIAFTDDGHMSSLHFEVVNQGETFEVRDCGSTNGTWLNNHRITVSEIGDGDLLKAGKSVLRVVLAKKEQPPRQPVTPPPTPPPETPAHRPVRAASLNPDDTGDRPKPSRKSPIQFSMDYDPDSHSGKPDFPASPRGNAGTGRAAGTGGSPAGGSPIESVVIPVEQSSPLLQPGFSPSAPPARPGSGATDNPFSDSCDFGVQPPVDPVNPGPAPPRPGIQARGFVAMERKIQATVEEAMALVLAKLMGSFSLRLVCHFRKIRIGVPAGIAGAEPLFEWFGSDSEGTCSPVMLGGEALDQPEFISLLPRLCRADALMAFLGSEPKSLGAQVRSMMQTGVSGFAEDGGFLPCCWPSSFMTLMDISGTQVCEQLFAGIISGAVFCTPGRKQLLRAYASPDMAAMLDETGFQEFV